MKGAATSDSTPGVSKNKLVADSLSAGFVLLVALTVVQRLVGFSRQLIICRMLTPEELGRWNLAYSMIVLAAPLVVLGIPGTFGRYTEHFRQQGQLHLFLRRITWLSIGLTLLGGVGIIVAAKPVAWLLFRDVAGAPMILTLAFALITVIAFNFLIELLTSLRQVKIVSWMRFACSALFLAISYGLLAFYRLSAVSIVIGYAAACLLTSLAGGISVCRSLRLTEPDQQTANQPSIWIKLLPFAGWLWLADLLNNLFAAADRYMIVHFAEGTAAAATATVGQYHSSRLFPEQIVGFATIVAAALLPYLSHDWERGNRESVLQRTNLAFKLFALCMTAAGMLLLLIAPWLFGSVLGGKYAEGLSVTSWSIVTCIWYGLFILSQNYLFCCERAKFASVAVGFGLALNIALNFALLPILGLLGAVLATACGNGLALLLVARFAGGNGMQWNRGTALVAIFPLCLVLSGPLALVITSGVIVCSGCTSLLFTTDERRIITEQIQTVVSRLRAFVSRRHRFRYSPRVTP